MHGTLSDLDREIPNRVDERDPRLEADGGPDAREIGLAHEEIIEAG